jgi:hypothetical protein
MLIREINKSYFYKITNNNTLEYYYGSGSRNKYTGGGSRLKEAQKKLGMDKFTYIILKYFNTRGDAYNFEGRFLSLYKIPDDPMSYNVTRYARGGGNGEEGNLMISASLSKYFMNNPNCRKGDNNGRYNKKIYKFYNLYTLEFFEDTKYNFAIHIGSNASRLSHLMSGKNYQYRGWILYDNIEKFNILTIKEMHSAKISESKIKNDIVHLYNYIDMIEYKGTISNFLHEFSGVTRHGILRVLSNKNRRHKSWILYEFSRIYTEDFFKNDRVKKASASHKIPSEITK